MKRNLVPRILALGLVVLLGGYYILVNVLQLRIGDDPIDVRVELSRAGGIYTNADVTYRGVSVGTVTAVDVEPQGVSVNLRLEDGTRIPSDVDASIRQLSAIGEQYVELVPASDGGPLLRDGSVIPADRATVPVPIGDALNNLGGLLDSLPEDDLATVRSFLVTGFRDTGPDLRTLISSSQTLTRALSAAQPQTERLIVDGLPVLGALDASGPDFAAYTRNLNELSAQFAASDADLRALIAQGGPATGQLTGLLADIRDDLAGTIDGFAAGSEEVLRYQPQVQEIFRLLPIVALDLRDITAGGTLRNELLVNVGQNVCTYLGADQLPVPDQTTAEVDTDNRCGRGFVPDLLQRGADPVPSPRPTAP